jgi:IS30 family transposase
MACQLTFFERERISQMHDAGALQTEIAAELGRARSTISRELKRNSREDEYCAVLAAGGVPWCERWIGRR